MEVLSRDMAGTASSSSPDAAPPVRPITPPISDPNSGRTLDPLAALLPPSIYEPASQQSLEPLIIPIPPIAASTGEALDAKPGWFGRRGSAFPGGMPKIQTRRNSPPVDIEMGNILAENATASEHTNAEAEGLAGKIGDRSREETAMAKWRKWIIDQPVQPVLVDSPVRDQAAQSLPLSPTSRPTSPLVNLQSPQSSTALQRRSGDCSPTEVRGGTDAPDQPDFVYNTESVRALRHVELAIDAEILNRTKQNQEQLHRMSTNARLSPLENPFIDLAARLASRRVRPIVLELVQALGHYIDVIWTMNFPDTPCPWVDDDTGPSQSHPLENGWKSRMITAVHAGKRTGHVASQPTGADLKFWEDEVVFGVRDTNEVVGPLKGVGWAFKSAMIQGQYGDVDPDNVIDENGAGGNYARLLNDLEEVLWGDAAPRPTDLAFDLPTDFDPYKVPDPEQGPTGSTAPLTDFFAVTLASPASHRGVVNEYHIPLPELLLEPSVVSNVGEGLTLEEIGRRRHQAWLESRRAEGWIGL